MEKTKGWRDAILSAAEEEEKSLIKVWAQAERLTCD